MRRRVLIVEDDADAAGTLAELLADRGYEPMCLGRAEEALAVIPRFKPEKEYLGDPGELVLAAYPPGSVWSTT